MNRRRIIGILTLLPLLLTLPAWILSLWFAISVTWGMDAAYVGVASSSGTFYFECGQRLVNIPHGPGFELRRRAWPRLPPRYHNANGPVYEAVGFGGFRLPGDQLFLFFPGILAVYGSAALPIIRWRKQLASISIPPARYRPGFPVLPPKEPRIPPQR